MKSIALLSLFLLSGVIFAQENESLVMELDELRSNWDTNAAKLKSYEGLGNFCSDRYFRQRVVDMLDGIHHYDTLLFNIVSTKGATDKEATATIKDIKKLESEYTTKSFRNFIHKECNTYNEIENNFGGEKGKAYNKEVGKLEKELKKYVSEITKQIDLIDEHAHHLDLN